MDCLQENVEGAVLKRYGFLRGHRNFEDSWYSFFKTLSKLNSFSIHIVSTDLYIMHAGSHILKYSYCQNVMTSHDDKPKDTM